MWNCTDDSKAGKVCYVTIPADDMPRVTEHDLAVEVVSACYLNVLLLVSKQLDWNTGGLSVATSLEISMWVGTSLCECVLVSQQPDCLLQPFSSSLTLCPRRRVMYLIFIKPTFVFFTAIFSGSSSAASSHSKISLAFCRVSTPSLTMHWSLYFYTVRLP